MIVDVSDQVDGERVLFNVGTFYRPGSVRVIINGLLRKASDADGWIERGGVAVELRVAPRVGDRVQVRLRRWP